MTEARARRALWLLNHGTARRAEVELLRHAGITEVFAPKSFPADPNFRSASVDWSLDATLTIPPEDLAALNAADWYGDVGPAAWAAADRHFDLLFLAEHGRLLLRQAAGAFSGAVIWRAYGLPQPLRYADILQRRVIEGQDAVRRLGRRFYFGEAYDHLHLVEPPQLAEAAVYLPAGMAEADGPGAWTGGGRELLFVCPEIAINEYYRKIHARFAETFAELPHVVLGSQSVPIADPAVLGFLPRAEFERRLREAPAMFYHSTEPRHVHYHPFEAVRAGLPLVFMAGGMLDRMGGATLPGRCRSAEEARRLVERLQAGDRALAERIRAAQARLLAPLLPAQTIPAWQAGIARIRADLDSARSGAARRPRRQARIAVILPHGYRGGTLRAAKAVANALSRGAAAAGDPATVVLAHLDPRGLYQPADFADLDPAVARRPFAWRHLGGAEAQRALLFAARSERWQARDYLAPDDGINDLADCDLWLVVSDRPETPILPLRPIVRLVFDYLQRYEPAILGGEARALGQRLIEAAHEAERVLVTSDFTRRDALNYVGLPDWKVRLVPHLPPRAPGPAPASRRALPERPYFLWSCNVAPHKNHQRALDALALYYEGCDEALDCVVTGVGSEALSSGGEGHLAGVPKLLAAHPALKAHLRFAGELPEADYWACLREARFLWHPARVDNGSFSVIEAAQVGVPSLSGDYPAMREMDGSFALNLAWMDPRVPEEMAEALRRMQQDAAARRTLLPAAERLLAGESERAAAYWNAVRDLL